MSDIEFLVADGQEVSRTEIDNSISEGRATPSSRDFRQLETSLHKLPKVGPSQPNQLPQSTSIPAQTPSNYGLPPPRSLPPRHPNRPSPKRPARPSIASRASKLHPTAREVVFREQSGTEQ